MDLFSPPDGFVCSLADHPDRLSKEEHLAHPQECGCGCGSLDGNFNFRRAREVLLQIKSMET